MGLRDVLFGRTPQVQPKLDNLFALSTAALTLQSELDLVTSGQAGLCFKAGSGEASITSEADIEALLNFDEGKVAMSVTTDDLGFTWLVIHDGDIENMVTRIHGANTTLVEHGLGPRLLCAVFGFVPATEPGEGAV